MKNNINLSDLLKHLSFWHNKTDDECIKLASNEYGVDAEQALLNMLERDFCTSINNNIIKCLYMNKGKEKAEEYAKFQYKDMFEMLKELDMLPAKNDYLAGYNEEFKD